MRQSVDAMADLAGTYMDWNPHMIPALAAQKADYLFGGAIICLAFFLQLLSFTFPTTWIAVPSHYASAVPWVAMVVTIVSFFALWLLARQVAGRFEVQIKSRLNQRDEEAQVKREERKKVIASQRAPRT